MKILLVLAFSVLSFGGMTAARISFSLYGLELGASAAQVGGIMAMFYLFSLLLSWPIGVLADRYSTRWLLVGGTTAGAAGALVPYLYPALASLYISAVLIGLTLAFTNVLVQNLVGAMSRPEDRTRNFSNFAITGSLANFVGPLIAGVSIDYLGHRQTCATIALVLVAGIVLLLGWGKALPRSEPKARSTGNLWHTLADRRLWGMLTVSSLAQLGNDIFLTFLPVYAHRIGLSATTIGIVLSAFAIGSLGVRIGMVRLVARLGAGRLLALSLYGAALAFMLVPLATGPLVLAALTFLSGMCQGCAQPLTMILLFNSAEEGRSGETIGLRMTVNNIARMFGPMLFGGMASLAGLQAVFWINGILAATAGRMSRRTGTKPP